MSLSDELKSAHDKVLADHEAADAAQFASLASKITDAEAATATEKSAHAQTKTALSTETAHSADLNSQIQIKNGTITDLNALVAQLRARIKELETTTPPVVTPPTTPADEHESRKPKSFPTWQAAVAELGLPTAGVNYVVWDSSWPNNLETAFATKLKDGDVLVLPERDEPYLIDSSKGFMAAGVKEMEYISDADFAAQGYNAKFVSGWTPVNSSSGRLWFAMTRARKGILGLGPRAVVKPSDSGYKGQRQPKGQMLINYNNGTSGTMIGVQQKLIETANADAIFANFKLERSELGTIAYSAIGVGKGKTTVRRLWIDRAWQGFAGIPNGEAGGFGIGAEYDIKGLLLTTDPAYSSSPIMFNRATGGKMEDVWIGRHRIGMITHWKSSGTHTYTNVTTLCGTVGHNLEENLSNFVLNWTGGGILSDSNGSAKHLNIHLRQKVNLKNVKITGYYGAATNTGKLMAHVYGAEKLSKSDITWDGGEILYLPASNYTV